MMRAPYSVLYARASRAALHLTPAGAFLVGWKWESWLRKMEDAGSFPSEAECRAWRSKYRTDDQTYHARRLAYAERKGAKKCNAT
jgi:hypothetical protein